MTMTLISGSGPIPRTEPYVWVTGMAKLLGGDTHCLWSLWFRAHFQAAKRPSDFDTCAWTAKHATLVRDRAERLRVDGYKVYLENQNLVSVRGRNGGILAGKPDLLAVRNGKALVVDCKTASQHVAHCMQVLLYMLLLPRAHPACGGRSIVGELCYPEFVQLIEADQLTTAFKRDVGEAFGLITGDAPPPKTPSGRDCKYCNITAEDCPDRVDGEHVRIVDASDVL